MSPRLDATAGAGGATGRLVAVQRTPARGLPVERLGEGVLSADWGLVGDRHARPSSSRQIVLTHAEVLEALGLEPGATREQLTIADLGSLAIGDVVAIGTARLEITGPRVPCRILDGVRDGLMDELRGRGGWCARVIVGGTVRPGDAASVVAGATADPPWLRGYLAAVAEWEAATSGDPPDDGWSDPRDRLAHLIAWDRQAARQIAASAAGTPGRVGVPTDIDAFNAATVAELAGGGRDLWVLHDDWCTAVVDAARRWPSHASAWVRSLTHHYREHT